LEMRLNDTAMPGRPTWVVFLWYWFDTLECWRVQNTFRAFHLSYQYVIVLIYVRELALVLIW